MAVQAAAAVYVELALVAVVGTEAKMLLTSGTAPLAAHRKATSTVAARVAATPGESILNLALASCELEVTLTERGHAGE